jgi:catechol 1,2-dioxygenase
VPMRQGDSASITFDFELQRSAREEDEQFSSRARLEA